MLKRSVAALVAVPSLAVAGFVSATSAHAAPSMHAIANSKPSWLAHGKKLGAADASALVGARVYLAPNGGLAAVQNYAVAVSTKGSAQYRHFLTPAQYYAAFGTSSATVSQVESWLTSAGLKVTGVEAHNKYVSISGTVAQAEQAFGANINVYSHDGQTVQAPNGALNAPNSLASSVLAVSGIDTTAFVMSPASQQPAPPPAGFRNARPCSAYYGEKLATTLPQFNGHTLPYAPCGYTGTQFRSAYEGSTTLNGAGVTVAITDAYAAPTIAQDASTYAARNGDASYAAGQFSQSLPQTFTRVNSGRRQCGENGWYGEETLDVEAVHAMAQGAKIRYYASTSCYDADFLDTFSRVNDEDAAQIVTNSWGEAEQAERTPIVLAYEQAFLQGATEGITYMFSSGDNGDEVANTGVLQADYPPSDPYATAVGGTSTAINGTGALAWETGWGTSKYALSSDGTTWNQTVQFLYGAGGGESTLFAQPSYQAGVAPSGARGVPDVAMDADPTTGMLVGETQTFPDGVYYDQYRIGGTSLASPLFAGITALAFQHAGGGVGLLNPTIYAHSSSFTDVAGPGPDAGNVRADFANTVDSSAGILYSVRTFDQDSSLSVTPGWDDVTGLGSPNSGWLTAVG
ncbi:MAG TPA: S53 family peptidase [Jatrophihabitantaceae bacterium]|nr:S53 family peptidase [Jatrophihabitantaceae bacterium]